MCRILNNYIICLQNFPWMKCVFPLTVSSLPLCFFQNCNMLIAAQPFRNRCSQMTPGFILKYKAGQTRQIVRFVFKSCFFCAPWLVPLVQTVPHPASEKVWSKAPRSLHWIKHIVPHVAQRNPLSKALSVVFKSHWGIWGRWENLQVSKLVIPVE